MALSADEARDVTATLIRKWQAERSGRLLRIDAYLRGRHDGPYKPQEAGSEYRTLMDRSVANMLPLVVDVAAQALYVEGYRQVRESQNAAPWVAWQANKLDARQSAVYRGAMGYGTAYVTVVPGRRFTGEPMPKMRGVSPLRMIAVYDDPAEDDFPEFAIQWDGTEKVDGQERGRFRLFDDTAVYRLTGTPSGGSVAFEREIARHDLGVCPVVRFCDLLDLDGRARGQVEPLIPVQDRLEQTLFDLLMTQTFASYKIRTVTGIALPDDDAEAQQVARQMAQDRMLTAEDPETKFGQLDESPLGGFIDSAELAIRQMATISQTPPHHLLGQMANLSAEALAAAESGLSRKVEERKHSFGESWEQALRLAAALMGDMDAATDESAEVVWRDTESRSLAQTADALGKLAQMLGVPPQALWEKIPGVTSTEVERWKAEAASGDAFASLTGLLDRQAADVGGV